MWDLTYREMSTFSLVGIYAFSRKNIKGIHTGISNLFSTFELYESIQKQIQEYNLYVRNQLAKQ